MKKFPDFVKKHGLKNFSFDLLEITENNKVIMLQRERYYITSLLPTLNTHNTINKLVDIKKTITGRHFEDKTWLGKKHLTESKLKISNSMPNRRKVKMIDSTTNNIEIFNCIRDIERKYGFYTSRISYSCIHNTNYKGYYFQYIIE
jgi:hypothetical protein